MRASSSSSSYGNSLAATSLANRVKTIFKKAYELSTLCGNEVCVILYGPSGKLKTWPEEKEKVKDMALRYRAATKRKKSLNLHEFLKEKEAEKEKNPKNNNPKKKKKKKKKKNLNNGFKYPDWYPIFDHYSPHQLSQLVLSLEQTLSTLQERVRFVEAQKQRNTNLVHQSLLTPSSSLSQHHHQYQTQPLLPSQFSPSMYDQRINHLMLQQNLCGLDHNVTNTNYQHHPCVFNTLSTSRSNQLSNNQNHHLMQLYGLDPNITNTNSQHPCLSNTQDYPLLLQTQESSLNNNGFVQHPMMQKREPSGFDHNMCITNNNILEHAHLSNTVLDELRYDFQKNPDGGMVGSSSFSQDFKAF